MSLSRYNLNQRPYKHEKFLLTESALAFDGVDDHVEINQSGECSYSNDWSISVTFFTSNISALKVLLSKQATVADNGFLLYVDIDAKLEFSVYGGSGSFVDISTVGLNRLYTVVVSFNSASKEFEFFFNGLLVSTLDATGKDFTNTNPISIGNWELSGGNKRFFDGGVSEVRLFNETLDADFARLHQKNPFVLDEQYHDICIAEYLSRRSYFKDASDIHGLGVNAILMFDSVEQYDYTTYYIYKWVGASGNDGKFTVGAKASLVENSDHVEFNLDIAGGTTNIRFASTGLGILFNFKLLVIADAGNAGNISVFESNNGILDDITPGSTYTLDIKNGARPDMRVRFTGANSVGDKFKMFYYFMSADTPIRALPQHGVLSGWSDAEVVTKPEPTAVKNFYDTASSLNWTADAGATEIKTGFAPINNALYLNGIDNYIQIESYTLVVGFFIVGIDATGQVFYQTDLTGIDHEVSGSDLNIGKDGVTYWEGHIIGIWDITSISAIQKLQLFNNFSPRHIIGDYNLQLNFNEEHSTAEIEDISANKTVTLNNYSANQLDDAHADYAFIDLNTLR